MPEPDKRDFLDETIAVERIQQVVANARTVWFALIGFLAFIGLTLVSVQDIDFYSIAATTDLPLVNIAIPTTTFFWSAAVLAAVLHTYFHLYLVKLWDAVAEAPPEIGGGRVARRWEIEFGVLTEAHSEKASAPLGDRVFPWLVVDWALRRRPDREKATSPRPMDWLANVVTLVLIWLATPFVLFFFWVFSMPAHDAYLTLAIGAAFALSLYASLCGWLSATQRLQSPGRSDDERATKLLLLPEHLRARIAIVVLALVLVSLTRTQIEAVVKFGDHRWSSLAPIDLAGAEIAEKPADWHNQDLAERRFRVGWCRDYGLPASACAIPWNADQTASRDEWCTNNGVEQENCIMHFEAIDAAFESEWLEERTAYLANISGPDLRGRDLRGASASGAFLAGVDLSRARLDGADLSGARLEGADLSKARLVNANLRGARMEGSELAEANFERADMFRARLEGSNLSQANFQDAILINTQLDQTILQAARLDGAIILNSWFTGANFGNPHPRWLNWTADTEGQKLWSRQQERLVLRGMQLQEANLSGVSLRRALLKDADLRGARLARIDLYRASLLGVDLRLAGLEGADLSRAWLVRANLRGARLGEADLQSATLAAVDLSEARLEGADLSRARLEMVDLSMARLQSADWAGARIGGARLYSSDLSGGRNLTQGQLHQVIGDHNTILPRDAETGEQLYVWSCWPSPRGPEELLRRWSAETMSIAAREGYVCAPGEQPRRTGRPAAD